MKRRLARECALKVLFMNDVGSNNPDEALRNVTGNGDGQKMMLSPRDQEFCAALVQGVVSKRNELNSRLAPYLINWQLERLAPVVRNILQMALFETLYMKDIPPAVTINEAIELARLYQDEESSRFVNAVLDRIRLSEEGRD
ncbi:MAG: transcription antitermination factor NusB [Bacillota bacterium]